MFRRFHEILFEVLFAWNIRMSLLFSRLFRIPKILNSKHSIIVGFFAMVFLFVPFAGHAQLGSIANVVLTIFGWLIWVVTRLIGGALSNLLIPVLTTVASYNDFLSSTAVTLGWIAARDVANSFFVVALLIIAFSTILRIEAYNYKKMLPKLILMAILVNFSRTIAGFFIDISQVIMLTFLNVLGPKWPSHLISLISDMKVSNDGFEPAVGSAPGAAANFIAATLFALFGTLFTSFILFWLVLVIIGVLVMRVIMLWLLVALSPLPYVLSVIPGGESYGKKWWDMFTKYLIVGPVLAFFLWLSITTITRTEGYGGTAFQPKDDPQGGQGLTKLNSNTLTTFIVGIGMLVAGLMITGELGVAGGQWAGKLAESITSGKLALSSMKWGGRMYGVGLRAVGGGLEKAGKILGSEREGWTGGLGKAVEGAGDYTSWVGRGVQKLPAIPAAAKAVWDHVSHEMTKHQEEAVQDVFYNAIRGINKQTQKIGLPEIPEDLGKLEESERRELFEKMDKFKKEGNETPRFMAKLYEYLNPDFTAGSGKELEIQALLAAMTQKGDFNDFLKDMTPDFIAQVNAHLPEGQNLKMDPKYRKNDAGQYIHDNGTIMDADVFDSLEDDAKKEYIQREKDENGVEKEDGKRIYGVADNMSNAETVLKHLFHGDEHKAAEVAQMLDNMADKFPTLSGITVYDMKEKKLRFSTDQERINKAISDKEKLDTRRQITGYSRDNAYERSAYNAKIKMEFTMGLQKFGTTWANSGDIPKLNSYITNKLLEIMKKPDGERLLKNELGKHATFDDKGHITGEGGYDNLTQGQKANIDAFVEEFKNVHTKSERRKEREANQRKVRKPMQKKGGGQMGNPPTT
ncbi:MAG: hypothetical protein HY453_00765 [Parcubacteria group bacterium]|nr:hypothetical protein [Parcubacteria group bacterium]